MEKVKKSVTDVERKLGKIDAMTSKGADKMTLKDVIKMAQKGNSINSTINKGIKAFDGSDPSDADVKFLLEHMTKIVTLEEKQMNFAVANKPYMDKLHAGGLLKKNLKKNESTALALSKLMIEKCPPAKIQEAKNLDARAMAAFKKALDAYSNATGGEELEKEAEADESE